MTNLPPGLRYVSDHDFTWQRHRRGKGFRYQTLDRKSLPPGGLERAKKLAIPPAWTEVTISQYANGHIQAVGFDAKGRKQYIYHPDWVSYTQQHKFDRMVRFGEVLPELRTTVAGHMRQRTLSKERILATIVWLLENTFVRVGNKAYARENHSYGLTTLREKHVHLDGNTVQFSFPGKSGVYHEVDIRHRRVVKTIHECLELPGYELFQYVDESGARQPIDAREVNEYLHGITGETLSAKDFRTWGGTTLAGDVLYQLGSPPSETAAASALLQAARAVAKQLRNTVAVCRKFYIHPTIVSSYQEDMLVPHYARVLQSPAQPDTGLTLEEQAAWTLLKK